MIAQLTKALASFGAKRRSTDRLWDAAGQDPSQFARLFGEYIEMLERLCCARDQAPVFAHLAGEMMCRAVINCPDLIFSALNGVDGERSGTAA